MVLDAAASCSRTWGVKVKVSDQMYLQLWLARSRWLGAPRLHPQLIEKPALQAKDSKSAEQLIEESQQLETAGAVGIILELAPEAVAQQVSQVLKSVIGIGAGMYCDGRVQVWHDLVGLETRVYKHAFRLGDEYAQTESVQAYRNLIADKKISDRTEYPCFEWCQASSARSEQASCIARNDLMVAAESGVLAGVRQAVTITIAIVTEERTAFHYPTIATCGPFGFIQVASLSLACRWDETGRRTTPRRYQGDYKSHYRICDKHLQERSIDSRLQPNSYSENRPAIHYNDAYRLVLVPYLKGTYFAS